MSNCKNLPVTGPDTGKVCLPELLELHPFLTSNTDMQPKVISIHCFCSFRGRCFSSFVVKPWDFLLTCLKNSDSVCQTLFLHRSNYWLPTLVFPRALSRKWHEPTWIAKYCFHRVSGSRVLIISMLGTHLIFRVLNECSVCIMRYFLVSQRNTHQWFQAEERPSTHTAQSEKSCQLCCVSACAAPGPSSPQELLGILVGIFALRADE